MCGRKEGLTCIPPRGLRSKAWSSLSFVLGLSWKWMAWLQLSPHPLGAQPAVGARLPTHSRLTGVGLGVLGWGGPTAVTVAKSLSLLGRFYPKSLVAKVRSIVGIWKWGRSRRGRELG